MKKLIVSLVSLASINAFAQSELVDGIPSEHVVQVVEMAGRPGSQARAALVRNQETGDLNFVIVETIGGRDYLTVENDKLGLSELTNARLSVNRSGSVLISSNNQNFPSRDMWNRTLTVSLRNNYFVLSGFTLDYTDTAKGKTLNCDLNLLTGRGIRNGFKVPLSHSAPMISRVEESEMFYTCYGW